MAFVLESVPEQPQGGKGFVLESLPEEGGGFVDNLARVPGRTLRAAAKGVASVAAPFANPLAALWNATAGNLGAPQMNTDAVGGVDALLDRAGVSRPMPGAEEGFDAVAQALTGGGGTIAAANKVTGPVAAALAASPGMQAASTVTGVGAGEVARQNDAHPLVQGLVTLAAGAAPSVVQGAAAGTIRAALRGSGDDAAANYNRRRMDWENIGVDPSVGQASGTRTAQGVESTLAKAPGGAGVMARQAEAGAAQMKKHVDDIADSFLPKADATRAGMTIEKGIKGFVQRFKGEQDFLYSKVDDLIPKGTNVDVTNTRQALSELNADIPGAPELSKWFKNSRIQGIEGAVAKDADAVAGIAKQLDAAKADLARLRASQGQAAQQAGKYQAMSAEQAALADNYTAVPGMPRVSGRYMPQTDRAAEAATAAKEAQNIARARAQAIKAAEDRVAELEAAAGEATGRLPYEAMKKLRTLVGRELENPSLASDVPRSKWKALYGALSSDMEQAAAAAGPQAKKAFERANWYTKAGYDRIETVLDRVSGKDTAEKIFLAAVSPSEVKEGATTINAVMRSLNPEERKAVSAAVVRRMGQATAGKQNDAGDVFSSETFLTNWNNVSPDAKRILFSDPAARKGLDDLALAASRIRDGSKVFANPSGSSGGVAQLGTAATGIAAGLTGNLPVVGAILAGVGANNVAARLMTNPKFVAWVGKTTKVPPALLPTQLTMLEQQTRTWPDEDRQAVQDFIAQASKAGTGPNQPR